MGKITKAAGARHEATLSPALSEFIKTTVSIPLYQLPSHLPQLPRLWPFPRGDLYHWIPVLNRFDRILELFVDEYGLKNGPQTQPFERRLLLRGDGEDGEAAAAPAASHEILDQNFQADGDRQLVESILRFTKLLLENCGNRSLYASSGHLNHLLNTTSLSLLKVTLGLCLRLAQRYHASRQRMASMGQHHINLLSNHYNISLEKINKLSLPFVKTAPPSTTTFATPSARGKDKSTPLGPRRSYTASKVHGADMVSIVKEADVVSAWEEWASVSISFYESQTTSGDHAERPRSGDGDAANAPPVTPTPIRRTSGLGAQQTQTSRLSRSTAAEESSTLQGISGRHEAEPRVAGPRVVEIPASEVLTAPEHDLLKLRINEIPEDARYELLQKIRVAKALSSSKRSRTDIVAIRMLAVANLAYVHPDAIFQQRIAQPDSEEPRRLQLASQLSELVYPSGEETSGKIQDLHTIALCTLEALTKQRSKATDVFNALNANVNHGVLFYVMRKAVVQLSTEDDNSEPPHEEEEWRDALFSLLGSLPTSTARAGEQMVSAGLFDILVDFLTVRTEKAERNHPKVLNFLDGFVYNVRDAFQSLVDAKGLDAVSDLTAYEVTTSFTAAEQGKGMSDSYKTQLTDYRIPFHHQQTLRALFKFLNHMMSHSGNNHDRLLRNLIDSPQLLGALRTIIAHGRMYGSNVWSSAVNILSSFIHNEPTSYAVIAEAGLSRGFLEAVSQKQLSDVEARSTATDDNNVPVGDRDSDATVGEHSDSDVSNRAATLLSLPDRSGPLAQGILPSAEAIMAVPQAFGAICLNEAGMRLFQRSGALDSFFEIFESPEHVKVLDTDSDVPTALGNSFDELVRHHPPLKAATLKAVEEMVVRVGQLCLNRVTSKGVGAKLWKEGEDGQILVAGGRRALLGDEEPLQQGNELKSHGTKAVQGDDVDMQDADKSASSPSSAPQEISIKQVVDDEDSSEGPTTSQYINVACKFLNGFFSNTALCSAFIEAGGLEWVLDFATLPSLPYNFQQKMGIADEFSRLTHQLVEQKPHLTLPSLLKRMQAAIDVLAPLSAHTGNSAFFSPFTDLERAPHDSAEDLSRLENGTKYAKALVTVHTLCNAFALTFQSQMYNHRASNNVFSQVNLADMYCRLVESLGHLQRSCVWEEILLLKSMPSEIKTATAVPSAAGGFGSDEADEVLGIPHIEPPPPPSGSTSTTSDSVNGALTTVSEAAQSSARVNSNTAQFKNIRTLGYLLSQLPAAITPLFQAIGKNLLFRRSIEPYQKQKAVAVAGQLAAAAIDQLRFEGAQNASSANDRYSYWIVVLTSVSQLMMDEALDRNSPQTLTLVLQSFKAQGGLDTLGDILETFFDDAKDIVPAQVDQELSAEAKSRLNLILGGIKIILTLYSRIANAKYVVDAVQTTAMQSRSDRDRDKADFFSTAQFLVELRMAVIKPAQKLWYSDALMDKATTSIVKTVIDILKIVLEGESESGAFKRSDKIPRPVKAPIERWKVRRQEQLARLSEEYGEVLAREALYRCYDSLTLAREYCSIQKNDPRSTRNPVPPEEDPTQANSQGSPTPATGDAAAQDRSPGTSSTTEGQSLSASLPLMMQGIQTGDTQSEWPPVLSSAEEMLSSLLGENFGDVIHGLGPAAETPSSSTRENGIEASKLPGIVTVEDLDEERANLRNDLIDRSLNVLNVHDDVSFDLQELIFSAVTKASEPAAMRAEVGSTLVQSLISLQMEEDFRPQGKKIAAYANLLALIIQDKDFYEAIRDELKDNLPTMLGFIKVFPNQQPDETSPWIGHILAVFERPLSEDAQPVQIPWVPPRDDASQDVSPLPEPPEPVVPQEVRVQLFEAIIDILPRISKDEALALAVVRVLVILTRDRQLSTRLGQKRNIQRLFLMVKQLAGNINDRLQGAFMSVLRNIIEDEEIIRQIMRTEIQAMFDGRSQRQTDTTGYTRQMYQHVLRAPEIFVEVTSEKLKLARFDSNQRPQILTLKKDEEPTTASSNDRENNPETENASQAATDADKANPSTETEGRDELEKPKVSELKPPVVENPDGVIHYLLCELLAYKDVEDKEQPSGHAPVSTDAPQTDVEMANGDSDSASTSSVTAPEPKKPEKPEFRTDQHPIFIYRCFILQCLTELLASYNRTKVEFINFSRKADPQAATPSKPRSGVLNYLLNALVPVGTLNHADDIPSRKKVATSNWAMSAIVSLCSKTGERGFTKGHEKQAVEEEPELLFVRRFVFEHILKAYKDANVSTEPLDLKYSRLLSLADLLNRLLTSKPTAGTTNLSMEMLVASQKQMARIMYEKNFITALTTSIADIDLNFPNAKRAVKYILRPLKLLTQTAIDLSMSSDLSSTPGQTEEDEISTASSVSSVDDDREETPDLWRHSTLGILDPGRGDEDTDSEDDDDEDDEDMYEGEYGDEMDYEEDVSHEHDDDDVVSEEDEEIEAMGPIEGLSGEPGMDVEVIIEGEDDDITEDEDDSDEDSDAEDEDTDDEDDDVEETEDFGAMEEITGDDENASLAEGDEEEWGTEEEDGEDYPGQDEIEDEGGVPGGGRRPRYLIPMIANENPHELLERLEGDLGELEMDIEQMDQEYLEDEMPDEEDDEEDEEDYDEEDIVYEPGFEEDDDADGDGMRWPWDDGAHPAGAGRHHVPHHHHRTNPWSLFTGGASDRIIVPPYRAHRPGATSRGNDDGTNPLLQRSGRTGSSPSSGGRGGGMSDWVHAIDPMRPGRFSLGAGGGPVSIISNLINAMAHGHPAIQHHHHHGGALHFTIGGFPGGGPGPFGALDGAVRLRRPQEQTSRTPRDDPAQAVSFTPTLTVTRWQEQARLLFGTAAFEKAQRVINFILRLLVPPAIEEHKRRAKEAAERAKKMKEDLEAVKAKEEAERAEREAKEKKEREEQEAAERQAAALAEANAQAERSQETGQEPEATGDTQNMEGVEQAQGPSADATEESAGPSEPARRITTTLRGRELDITGMGIDLEYLEALPEELREEVLMQQVAEQRSQAAAAGEEPTDISREFLEALPADIREELLQQEAQDRRRREREEARRRAAASGGPPPPGPVDMDAASFLASLDPHLRQAVLMEQDEEMLAQLPREIALEARALGGDRRLNQFTDMPRARRAGELEQPQQPEDWSEKKAKPRPIVQMLDKAGVATLLRLMFIPQQGNTRQSLNGILRDVCENRQNRAEAVSILLSILQDGSADVNAVERSFAQLTLRAKQTPAQKTPQLPKRSSFGQISTNSEMSPLMVVQQCLSTLVFLTQYNPHISFFFLTEHETGVGVKSRSNRKGKGKESKASKYPLNALLSLLDRKLIIESSPVMEQLTALLASITQPLNMLLKKDKEQSSNEGDKDQQAQAGTASTGENSMAAELETAAVTAMNIDSAESRSADSEHTANGQTTAADQNDAQAISSKDDKDEKPKRPRMLTPPEVPESNLRLVVNILAARECSSKTFRDTISLISNLSAIPEAREIFGRESIKQAQHLAQSILNDLEDLVDQTNKAKTGVDVQGMALAKFSPGSSDQMKLLRMITALDYLFDPKRAEAQDKPASSSSAEGLGAEQKADILTTLYENSTFGPLWNKLSECLSAVRRRGNMLNVATILLPLIEVLMIVCKNTTLKDAPMTKATQKDSSLSSPPPESRMESLFFTFTEEHRKVLNDLVRQNPKLMSGSFALLVKNSKVLEFDNKRNYFNRKLHSRGTEARHPHQPLQLSVRRDYVFLDSFKSLYFKSRDEMKYGKLSIRFHGEEGVDAGGVTREWFQVLAKQMFNPDYALFNPVAADRTTFHPNPLSAINPEHLMFFKFIGRIIGKALYEGRVLDCHFSRAVYKRILGKPVSIKDMETLDLDYYKSLLWMLENDITDIITETFSVETQAFGETKIVDLIENGRNVPVTEENKHEYVRLVVEYRMIGSVEEQLEHFLTGFHDIVPAELIAIFNEQELELLISGLPDIDVDDWKNNTEYHNYTAASPQIQWFWRAVRSFDKEEQAKLLQFVTGTSKVPLNGFKELEGMNGFSRFNIHRDYGSKDRLPSSHTCFNQLDLPEYDSYETLRQQVYTAMTAGSEYFGFA